MLSLLLVLNLQFTPPKDLPMTPVEHRTQVDVFVDFKCTYCKTALEELQNMQKDYLFDINVRHLPLSDDSRTKSLYAICNPDQAIELFDKDVDHTECTLSEDTLKKLQIDTVYTDSNLVDKTPTIIIGKNKIEGLAPRENLARFLIKKQNSN
ncbi:MAG: DsbA family protein [Candidatus Gracilibacteria bacterium]|jgi:protein-disulfide isomerase|nr:DsbA family protein [Candidatus Gracilibacteria bacterium]